MHFGGEVNERGGDGDDEEDEKGGRAEGRFLHASGWWCGCEEWGVSALCVAAGCGGL
jgi:hypothetical protein